MGGLLNRSSSVRPEGTKTKWRKIKRKRSQKMETSTEGEKYLTQNDNEQENANRNLMNTYEQWNKGIDQQHLSNFNVDPPGAPRTYPANFPMIQNDLNNQSWSTSHDVSNQFYQGNSHPMTTISTILYDPNQYNHTNTFINQSQQVIIEERPSKKVQFAHTAKQHASPKTPLTNAQSWHEPSISNNDSTIRQEPVLNRQSAKRSVMPKSSTSLASAPVEKPIYVGIDHRATLAERGQTTANKRHHKNNEKNNSDASTNHRTRSHAHHQHKHQESNDPSTAKINTSTIIPNKQIQHTEQPIFNDNEIKISKTRGNRQSQSQHIEPQSLVDNDIKLSRSRGNHTQHRQQQQRVGVNRTNSPVRTEIIRRVETKQQDTSAMKISMSRPQQRQKQSTMTNTANITRTRV